MTPVDWIIVAAVLVSVVVGLLRGMTREIVSLAGWVLGALLAWFFGGELGTALGIDPPALAAVAGAVLIVAGVLIIAALVGALLQAALAAARLSSLDRLLGAAFGLAPAALVLGIAVLLAGAAGVPRAAWWKESALLPWLEAGVAFATPLLPDPLAQLRART
jgi:membrane protein required for colicin V production